MRLLIMTLLGMSVFSQLAEARLVHRNRVVVRSTVRSCTQVNGVWLCPSAVVLRSH